MAGEDLAGSVVYEVRAEVQPLLQGGNQVNRVLSEIEASLDENINHFKKLETTVSATAQSVSSATRSMGNMRGVFGQLGYQIQDVAVQLQMGQNAMMVFAQQGSQIASIFGPGGAIAGAIIAITGALAGALLPSLFNSKDATEDLETAQKSLADTVVKTDSGVSALSEKIQRLAAVSSDAAKAQIAVAMTDAQKAITAAGSVISNQINDLGSWRNSMAAAESQLTTLEKKSVDASVVLKELGGSYEGNIVGINILNNVTNSMAESFGISQTQAVGLVKVFRDLQKEPTAENMRATASALSSLSEQTGFANPKLNELTNIVNQNYISAANATDAINVLKSALDNLTSTTEASKQALSGNAEQLNKLVDAAKNEAATVGFSARQRAKYVAGLLGAGKAELQSIDVSYDKIEAYEKEQQALKDRERDQKNAASEAESAAKRAAAAQQQILNQLDQLSDKYKIAVLEQQGMGREAAVLAAKQQLGATATEQQSQKAGELAGRLYDVAQATRAAKEEEERRKQAGQNFTGLQSQASPVFAVDNQFKEQMAQLDEYAKLYPQKIAEVEATRAQIEEQYRQKRQEAMWQELSQQSLGYNMLTSAVDAFSGNASNAITGLLTGTMSAQEAMQSLGNTILNSVINSIVQVGVEMLKNFIIGQTIGAASTANGLLQASLLTNAWTPAAYAASVATGGAAAKVGAVAYGSGLATSMALSTVSGARYNGGPVSAGGLYQVGEKGKPEIYQASTGKQYMIPGDNGKVISNKDMNGGQVQVNIQFYDQTSGGQHSFQALASQEGGVVTIEGFLTDLDRNGPMTSGMIGKFGLSTKANGAF
ncbi:phage tail length tape measure family protein [Klebsiella pneumoniae]|nr:phage tail length tape measure family protein [Klebsiella pneumoniae]